jgi:hypothetical protein
MQHLRSPAFITTTTYSAIFPRSSPAIILRFTVREFFSSTAPFRDTAAAPSLPASPHLFALRRSSLRLLYSTTFPAHLPLSFFVSRFVRSSPVWHRLATQLRHRLSQPPTYLLRFPAFITTTSILYHTPRSSLAIILRVTVREVFSSMFADRAAAPSLPFPSPPPPPPNFAPSLSGVYHYDFYTLLHSLLIFCYHSSFHGS